MGRNLTSVSRPPRQSLYYNTFFGRLSRGKIGKCYQNSCKTHTIKLMVIKIFEKKLGRILSNEERNLVLKELRDITKIQKPTETDIKDVSDLHSSLLFIAIRYLEGMKSTPKLHIILFKELRWNNYIGSPIHTMNKRYSNLVKKVFDRGINNGKINNSTNFDIFRDQFLGGLEHIGIREILTYKNINIGKVSSELVNNLLSGVSR